MVAATERGICAVKLGTGVCGLERELGTEFQAAELVRSRTVLEPVLDAFQAYLDGLAPLPELPTDVAATAFQGRVWAALRKIEPGEKKTYSEVARDMGEPKAVRAVANACARNPVALVVPCHRVVPQDASAGAGGYRWGSELKVKLLAMEARLAAVEESEG